jgi:hypothetical protein
MVPVSARARQALDLQLFNQKNDVDYLGQYQLICPHDRQYVLRMIIRHAHGTWQIPNELQWLYPMLLRTEAHQRTIGVRHLCCYITVRHGLVTSVTDDQWHTDGFSTKITHLPEQNYIVSNCYPTEYVRKAIEFPLDFDPVKHNVHKYIANRIKSNDIKTLIPYGIYCLDPYNIHRRVAIPQGTIRTFVRISYTPIEIMDDANTPNPMLVMPTYKRDGVAIRDLLEDYDVSTRSTRS